MNDFLQSDEDGPCTDEELKMLCVKWTCKVDMGIDNFVFWKMRKTFREKFHSNEERFQRYIPKIFDAIEKRALESYKNYQEENGEKNKNYLRKCKEWREYELRRLRFLDKLEDICSTWTWSDDESDDDDSSENSENSKILSDINDPISNFTLDSCSSFATVINTQNDERFARYPETESLDFHASIYDNIGGEEIAEEVSTQTFLPETTSTQN